MRFWRWLAAFLLLLLVGLPAFPPLIARVLQEGLGAAGLEASWRAVGGYLLTGLELRGVRLEGEGFRLEADRLRLGYNLLGLRRKELPLRIWAEEGQVLLHWENLFPEEAAPAAPSPIALRVEELGLSRIAVQFEEGRRVMLPPVQARVEGTGPYQVHLRLPEGRLNAVVWRTGQAFEAWRIEARGELRAARYWFDGLEAGEVEGIWTVGPGGIQGRNQIKGARVRLVGFDLGEIYGGVDFDGRLVTANLVGRGLGGPLRGAATVDLERQEYRFRVEGRPTLPALAQHFGLRLPVEGEGPLVLEGRGWQHLVLSGRYSGEGRMLGEPLRYEGTLAFDQLFRLDALVDGAFFDRTFQARLALRGEGYSLVVRDTYQSELRLDGRGARLAGQGVLALPRPLAGEAELRFAGEGARWQLGVRAEGVGLPLFRPFSLSGRLEGEGARVQGQLGALRLGGTWDDLLLELGRLELAVGSLGGRGRLQGGRLQAELAYDSPYARFPLSLWQEDGAWRVANRYAQGRYAGGVFDLQVRDLPLEVLEPLRLSGRLRYSEGQLSGGWGLQGERLWVEGVLQALSTRFKGEVKTPWRALPLVGTADAGGLSARLDTLGIRADALGVRFQGPLVLNPQLRLEANLGLRGSRYEGEARLDTPWLQGRVEGRGEGLWLRTEGYARLSGPLWPSPALSGPLTLPRVGPLEVPPVFLRIDREAVRWAGGELRLRAGLPFEGSLPFRLAGEEGRLWARGNLERGRLVLSTPYGQLSGEGPWGGLAVRGRLAYAGYQAELRLLADLFRLAYQGRVEVPRLEGGLWFQGQGASLTYTAELQNGRLRLAGSYSPAPEPLEGLRFRLVASDYDLAPWGLPATVRGSWSERGGRLTLRSAYGQAQLTAPRLLGPFAVRVESPYASLAGWADFGALNLRGTLNLPYLRGTLAVQGPWQNLAARGQGVYALPYLEPLPWRFEADVWERGWRLSGPLALEGQGLAYRGQVNWPYRLQGRAGVLRGALEGEGLSLSGELETTYAGLPLKGWFRLPEAALERLEARLTLPGGRVEWAGRQALFDLAAAPLAQAFGLEVEGWLRGWLDLEGRGEAEGQLRAWGQRLQLDYKDRSLALFLPEHQAGVVAELAPGQAPRLVGIGALEGTVELGEVLRGSLSYQGPVRAVAELQGTLQRPQVVLEAATPWAELRAQGSYILARQRAEGSLELGGPYAQGRLAFFSVGSRYQASGRLESLQYLRQGGVLRLSGEGGRWQAVWAAPLRLEASGQGAHLERLELAGQGRLELPELGQLPLSGRLGLSEQGFRGRMQLGGPVDLALVGEGERLWARGTAYGVGLEAYADLQGSLGGRLGLERRLAESSLRVEARLGGRIFQPELEGEGALEGRGARVALRFGYREGLWAEAEGAGLSARLEGRHLRVDFSGSLEPFTGLPVSLRTQGEGPWERLVLPLRLSGPNLEAEGLLRPAQPLLQLAGRYERQRFELAYDGMARLRLEGPYATGLVRWVDGAPSGLLSLDLPLPIGRLVGRADLDGGRVTLEGQEGLRGRVLAQLREGWGQPARWRVEAGLQGALAGQPLGFSGRFELDGAPLALRGGGQLELPGWGGLALEAQGEEVEVRGQEGLDPLQGRLVLRPLRLDWSYVGALPRGLGELTARGTYPGRWAQGRYQGFGQALALEGEERTLRLSAPGLEARLAPEGLSARLAGYRPLEGLQLSGVLEGAWQALSARLEWAGWGRQGGLEARWAERRLEARLEGDLAGALVYDGAWKGRLELREGYFELSGTGLPLLEGEALGLALRLRYPWLEVAASREELNRPDGHLTLELARREASGSLALAGLVLRGQGPRLEGGYPLADGRLLAELDLRTLVLELSAPGLGTGALRLAQGQLGGAMTLSLYGLEASLEGSGEELRLRVRHPETPWLPWGAGGLEGRVGLDGAWRLLYQDVGRRQRLRAEGRLLEGRLEAEGAWLEGQMRYAQSAWQGRLRANLPLETLASRLELELEGREVLEARGHLRGDLGRLDLEARLGREGPSARAGFDDLAVEEVPWVNGRLPFLTGRATGSLLYEQGRLRFELKSPALRVRGDELALASRLEGVWQGGRGEALLSLERASAQGEGLGANRTTLRLRLGGGRLEGEASAQAFPLHWLFSAWAGELAGRAFWTGQARFSLNLEDPWASRGVWVGEYLRFEGGGDTLVGRAALRFEQERLYIDHLALSGKGTWSGSGYYGRRGSDLQLNLENTVFTPVLQVIPNLKPLTPEGSGTLRLRANGRTFELALEDFKFRLGPVRAETPRALVRVADSARAEGRLRLTAPYPAEAQLSGEGDLSSFTVRAVGSANLPLLSPDEPFALSFSYPAYTLDATLQRRPARLYGTLFPQLILTLQGQVPVSYPRYFLLDGLLDTNLILRYQRGSYLLQGAVEVLRARLGLPEGEREVSIALPAEPAQAGGGMPVEFVNVQIRAERGVLIQESLAQGELAGEVYLSGSLLDPYLSGEVVPLRGSFRLWDRDFVIRDRGQERSYARFTPSAGILPELQIIADTTVLDRAQDNQRIQVNLTLRGTFVRQNGRIKVNLTPSFVALAGGEPARKNDGEVYTEAEIYALLLLGRSDLSALPADIAQTGLQAAVQNFIVGQLERELARALGLDQVRLEIPALNGGTLEETRFTVGRYLSSELFLAYSVDLRGYQTLFAEYQQGDFRFRFSSEVFPRPRPELTLGYTLRPLGIDLTLDLATGVSDGVRGDGIRFGVGLTFRF
ncbi:translocation/assembly module TamB [Meiothermus sp. QL-1]|uniref:translocation/assembly module TamB domain-containing protein n=1 Tax=Meiothermus sp. QL-1 TaxID=2058095 RepID=UPI000E0B25FC|nr:translocation/assembly module TamB domain-containing protein [Meiothermus sp. QL-1]RDI94650.1 translocation/assembly module TamB [Meiothermus sp. QL-1]